MEFAYYSLGFMQTFTLVLVLLLIFQSFKYTPQTECKACPLANDSLCQKGL